MSDDLEYNVGKWVLVSSKDEPWILVDLDVDDHTLNQTPRLSEVTHAVGDDAPLDLLWHGNEYVAIPRRMWYPPERRADN